MHKKNENHPIKKQFNLELKTLYLELLYHSLGQGSCPCLGLILVCTLEDIASILFQSLLSLNTTYSTKVSKERFKEFKKTYLLRKHPFKIKFKKTSIKKNVKKNQCLILVGWTTNSNF